VWCQEDHWVCFALAFLGGTARLPISKVSPHILALRKDNPFSVYTNEHAPGARSTTLSPRVEWRKHTEHVFLFHLPVVKRELQGAVRISNLEEVVSSRRI
jgi:hypothetical protein